MKSWTSIFHRKEKARFRRFTEVRYVVSWYAPTDINKMYKQLQKNGKAALSHSDPTAAAVLIAAEVIVVLVYRKKKRA